MKRRSVLCVIVSNPVPMSLRRRARVTETYRYGGISLSGAKKTRVFFVGNVSCMSLFSAVNVLVPVSLREAPLLLMDLYQ